MTFPNRAGYVPGQQRRQRKYAVAGQKLKKPRRMSAGDDLSSEDARELKGELRAMLDSISPAHSPGRGLQSLLEPPTTRFPITSGLSKEELKAQVERSRKRLFDDEHFQDSESYGRLLAFKDNPALQSHLSDAVDPFAAAIGLLPAIPQSHPAIKANGGGFFGDSSTRSRHVGAMTFENVACAVDLAVEDPAVRAQYQQAAHNLQEWGERRAQHQRQRSSNGDGVSPTPTPTSLSSLSSSSYVLELATRNGLPKKRTNLSKTAKTVLRIWFEENLHHPYPTEEEKEWLAANGGITMEQVNNWFINTRGRKWKPMLNRLMAEKQAGDCKLYDQMVEKIEEPYRRDI
ncbi:hypothetical protein BBJ28_00020072 [Nothophytophthora sp. Chile5]|nr:hypothetical protein BBJ28_00020072 [Nothophytophthora sp. Chile5]